MKENIIESLELLREIRVQVRGNVESSAAEKLDEAISKLEAAQRGTPDKLSRVELLAILGIVVELIPAVAQLIERIK